MTTLPPATWARVIRLLDEVEDLDPAARARHLDRACAGDAVAVRKEVERLLEAGRRMGDFLEAGPDLDSGLAALLDEDTQEPQDPPPARPPGTTVGPWRIVRELGRGGMGIVYLAERADGQYERRVALKVIKRGMDTDAILRRFLAERRILARLEHPNIAVLYDGGATADGVPYIAMELVEGRPITAHAAEESLSIDERLRLFRQACIAVRHAQRNLIVHRDLKPSNVLVTRDGTVKLLDFGIATMLGPDGVASQAATVTVHPFLTPAYAAPEQLRGDPVTTATDVHGLGAVLYELLAGCRPEHGPDGTVAAPSARAARPAEQRRLRGDLDILLLKALRDRPEERYASAEALLEEIDRHLAGLPLAARPDGGVYRAGRFIRRHRFGVAMSALLAAAVLTGLVGTSIGLVRARRAEALAREEAETARQVTAFLAGLFLKANPRQTRGATLTARDLLDAGAERIDADLAAQPRARATLLHTIAASYQALGLTEKALPLAEQAVSLRAEVFGPDHLATLKSRNLLVAVYTDLGRQEDALRVLRESLPLAERSLGPTHDETIRVLSNLGVILQGLGRSGEARDAAREALDRLRRAGRGDTVIAAHALQTQADALAQLGQAAEAEPLHGEALRIFEAKLGADHPETLMARSQQGLALHALGRNQEAEALTRETLDIQTRVLGPDHIDTLASAANLGGFMIELGRAAEAEPMLAEALRRGERALPPGHSITALLRSTYGYAIAAQGRRREAEPILLRAYAEVEADEQRDVYLPQMRADLAAFYRDWGKPDKAARYTGPAH
jgi:tetratricopeptide (TPR) repeat protein/tRNA A-37 threonylcarbamoyl transferase component Bud32